jgi:predicted dehydrogenase
MVGFNRRFAPATARVREFMKGCGPLTASFRFAPPAIPPDHWTQDEDVGGGRIVGEACHMVDLCAYLVGAPPVEVFARALGRDPERDDSTVLVLGFADGSTATIEYLANASAELPKERFEVSADGRTASCDNFRTTRLPGGRKLRTASQDKGQQTALREVVEALRAGAASPFSLEGIEAVSRATFAAAESARTRAAVRLGLRAEGPR